MATTKTVKLLTAEQGLAAMDAISKAQDAAACKAAGPKWFIRKNQDGAGYWAVAVSADGKRESRVGPWGKPLPTVEATRQYIRDEWYGGNPRNMPGSVLDNVGEPDEFIVSRCHFDLC